MKRHAVVVTVVAMFGGTLPPLAAQSPETSNELVMAEGECEA